MITQQDIDNLIEQESIKNFGINFNRESRGDVKILPREKSAEELVAEVIVNG